MWDWTKGIIGHFIIRSELKKQQVFLDENLLDISIWKRILIKIDYEKHKYEIKQERWYKAINIWKVEWK